MKRKFEVTREGATQAAVAVAIAIERDGFAALLGRWRRVLARDLSAGVVSAEYATLHERRVDEMLREVASGMHIVGTRPLDDPDPASPDAPVVGSRP